MPWISTGTSLGQNKLLKGHAQHHQKEKDVLVSELTLEELAVTVSQVTPGRTRGIGALSKGSGKLLGLTFMACYGLLARVGLCIKVHTVW